MNRKNLGCLFIMGMLCFMLSQAALGMAEQTAREAKNLRYNGGICDLTTSTDETPCFSEQYEPAGFPLVPIESSLIVAVGTVTSVEGYLSADRTRVYSEISLAVGEIVKSPKGFQLGPKASLIIDLTGGTVTISPGRILRDETRSGFMGRPHVGGRYVFFLQSAHKGRDLIAIKIYELRDGKVFKLSEDGSPGTVLLSKLPETPDQLSVEKSFLAQLRKAGKTLPAKSKPLDFKLLPGSAAVGNFETQETARIRKEQ